MKINFRDLRSVMLAVIAALTVITVNGHIPNTPGEWAAVATAFLAGLTGHAPGVADAQAPDGVPELPPEALPEAPRVSGEPVLIDGWDVPELPPADVTAEVEEELPQVE